MDKYITLATLAAGAIAPVWKLTAPTWESYCEKFGYHLHVSTDLTDPRLAPSWNKCFLVARLLRDTGRPVWWIDSDMTMVKPDLDLESPVPGGWNDMNVSVDWNGFCFGLFRASPTQWTINFLEFVPMLGDVANLERFGKVMGVKWEQNAIKLLAMEFPEVNKHLGVLPASWVNPNPHKPNPSDVIWHFGGRSMDERIRWIRACHKNL